MSFFKKLAKGTQKVVKKGIAMKDSLDNYMLERGQKQYERQKKQVEHLKMKAKLAKEEDKYEKILKKRQKDMFQGFDFKF